MAVTVVDNRILITAADDNTGGTWTGAAGGFATSPRVEGTNAWVGTLNTATGQLYFTDNTSRNISDTLIYVWSNNFALQGLWTAAAPPNAMYLGEASNQISIRIAGSDRKVFSHLDQQDWNWDCLLIDGALLSTLNAAGRVLVLGGTFAGLNTAAITRFGADMTTLSKGLGGGTNVACDVVRIGNNGLTVAGGTTGDRGTFFEIVALDRSIASGRAHGIIREYTTGIYGIQGPLTFGAATGDTWFDESGVTIAFEARDVGNNRYYLALLGGTGSNNFLLRNSTITTAGPFAAINFNPTTFNQLVVTGNLFSELGNAVSFGNDTAAQSHQVSGNTFQGCGQIDPGAVIFENNIISGSTAGATGAVLLDADGTSNWQGLRFISAGTGHAIYITAPGSYILTDITYSGYGLDGTTDAAVYNNSGGAVTLTISGGTTPTVRNGAGATTTIVTDPVTTQITVRDLSTGLVIQDARALVYVTDGANFPYLASVTITGTGTTATVTHTGHGLATGDFVVIRDANEDVYNGVYAITVTGANTYTYTTNETIVTSPATGTITATFAFLSGLTDINGQISDTRPVPANQPITGWVRKASASPYYQQGAVTGIVGASTGFSATIQLARDE